MTEFEATLQDGRTVQVMCEGDVVPPEPGFGYEVKDLKIESAYVGETPLSDEDAAWDEIEQLATNRICDEYTGEL